MEANTMAGANIIFPDCIICLNPLQSDLVIPGFCGHVFHNDCLKDWRNKGNNDKCPVCKRDASHTIKLIFDIKYNSEDNITQEPQTLNELLKAKQILEKKNKKYENEIKELTEYNEQCQKKVEDFAKRVEENLKNITKYKNDYLNFKYSLEQEKEKNQKLSDIIDKLTKEKNILENFKKRFEFKSEIDDETEKIILNKDIEKAQENFETQFYKLLNDDDEKKGLREYFYVLQQKILKLTKENEELKKDKKNFFVKEKEKNYIYNNGTCTTYTQLLMLTSEPKKRNYIEYMKDNKINDNNKLNEEKKNLKKGLDIKDVSNDSFDATTNNNKNNKGINLIINENSQNKRKINTIKLNYNNNKNIGKDNKKLFTNPLNKKELTFKNK